MLRHSHSIAQNLRSTGRLACRFGTLFIVAASLVAIAVPTARGADEAPSLKLVPQDASFYVGSLRMREQVEIVANSNFWKRLNEMEFVKQMKTQFEMAQRFPHNPISEIFRALEQPENQQAADVVREMLSDEIFIYGGADFTDSLVVATDAMNAVRFAPLLHQVNGAPGGIGGQEKFTTRMALNAIQENINKLKVPEFVIAARIKNKQAAEEQLKRLEGMARALIENERDLEKLRGKLKAIRVGESQFITLTIDKTVIPWDEIPFEQLAEQPGEYDKLRDKLKELTLVIALGIHKDYVVLSVGKSTDHLAAWGQGPTLADHPKLKPWRDKGNQRYTGLAYASAPLMQATGVQPDDVDGMVELAENMLPASKLPEAEQQQIITDVKHLAVQIKAAIPPLEAVLAFSYLTPRGYESFSYNWTHDAFIDGSKKLPMLGHLGANPLLAVAARAKVRPQDYDLMVQILGKGRFYFEKYAVPQFDRQGKAIYQQVAEIGYPLLARVDKVNRDLLMPALADGQSAFIIDAGMKARKWHEQLPATVEETTIPMPAIVLGVSDAALADKALGEYRLILNDLAAKVRPLIPGAPEIQLPAAEQKKQADGSTVYYFPIPEKAGLNKQLAPNAGLSEKFLVFSFSPRLTVNLLKDQPLAAASSGPLAGSADRPLAGAAVFDFPQLVDVALPWINEGIRFYVRNMEERFQFNADPEDELPQADEKPLGDSPAALATLAQVKQFCELIKAFRGYTSVTYVEDGVKITHGETRFEDLK